MKPLRLYAYIEREWDFRLSGAEKMLLRQALSGTLVDDSLLVARQSLEKYYFTSPSFREWQKIVLVHEVEFAEYYEMCGRKRNENRLITNYG